MCGICGQLALRPGGEIERPAVAGMCGVLEHRGPDETRLHAQGPIGLGATRLAIIDPAGGRQPVANEDRTVFAVQNGEIYNYRALREELLAAGHRFTSAGDTEVLVHLYEEHGAAFVERLRGMFAVALWDGRARRLILARDRLGIKPLVYAEHDGRLLFASEIKALLATGIPRALDRVALDDYLSFDYVPGPRSMFAGVRKLPAGACLKVELDPDRPTRIGAPQRYWDVPRYRPEDERAGADVAALTRQLRTRLEDAVAATTVSDVPVGAFLSGGLDSSIVVALMARQSSSPVQTFSVGFREESYNELPYARQVAARYGTAHNEEVIAPDVESVVHQLVEAFDEPFADSSAVAAWYVAQSAARHTRVVLSGDGGDETFGGYVIYQADRLARLYRRLPSLLSEGLLPAVINRLPASHRKMSLDLKLKRFVRGAAADPVTAHASWRAIFTSEMKAQLYANGGPDRDALARFHALADGYPGPDALNRWLYLDTKVSLVDDMLTKVDRTSMAHSLEVRVPLLDHRLVEWMAGVPSRLKVRPLHKGLTLKYLLKQVAYDLLPREIVDRPKAGFHVPVPLWLKNELRGLLEHQLSPAVLRRQGVFDPGYVAALTADHRAGRADYSRNLWGLLMFGLWYERFMR